MNRTEILETANEVITGDRQNDYGEVEDNFDMIAHFWTIYLGHYVTNTDVANMMIMMKVARNKSGHGKCDNWIDICGYSALGGELYEKSEERKK